MFLFEFSDYDEYEGAATRYINSERINLELDKAVGRVVRAFDPCIACATR